MKKNTIKAFTLTEMLIVIVIIGILIAALLPRMQAAQGRARDVSRKTALSQIQSAIVVYQGDYGAWPGDPKAGLAVTGCIMTGCGVSEIASGLLQAGMTSVPVDPLKANNWTGLGEFHGNASGDYSYLVTKRNSVSKGGFALMAKVEVPGSANWVVCKNASDLTGGYITSGTDIAKEINLCANMNKGDTSGDCSAKNCKYYSDDELRYLITY